ncbi:Bug family tripartite tricarboxylate transporter substrate binding protein [Pelosinus propionicus]|uniref:Tripartite-type tricarboxylate transporter, receptor component TctC n=1 Tax=Pelosinus propionicus DSM 13327 TaxID=1123291 RepID=A0A1I4HFL1_9FIRM|nr:tripartite tricarboxylate transporter substrate binding protein [Pelosinus propionicus]SFL40540.1 Tripartite-type tricarboxylate transporter, receptor component TctC [Pelosinus propionicus DSM 13327]
MPPKTVTTTSKYPEKPITLIVPFSAGGGMDLLARAMEKTATTNLGQPLIILNKPGGGGTIGWNELAGVAPDGYTIGISGVDLILQSLYGSTKYNYPTALEPIVQITSSPYVMVIQADQPWKNVDDLIGYARQHPGEIKIGNSGVGSVAHVLGEMLAHTAGVTLESVPFRGGSEALTALLGGHIQATFTSPATIKDHIKNGTLRVIAVPSEQRLTEPIFANMPTFKEQGLDIVFSNWMGVAVPKEMPIEVKNKLADGLKAIILDPEFKNKLENIGLQVDYLPPKEAQQKWVEDSQKLSKIVQETGILDKFKEQRNKSN